MGAYDLARPLGVGKTVRIDERNDVGARDLDSGVASVAGILPVRTTDQASLREFELDDGRRVVLRAVDDDHLELALGLSPQRFEALANGLRGVIGDDNH